MPFFMAGFEIAAYGSSESGIELEGGLEELNVAAVKLVEEVGVVGGVSVMDFAIALRALRRLFLRWILPFSGGAKGAMNGLLMCKRSGRWCTESPEDASAATRRSSVWALAVGGAAAFFATGLLTTADPKTRRCAE